MRVYFDYNATTPLAPEAAEAVVRATRELFGNASSVHHFGQQAKAALDESRSAVAALINADPSEIVFTSGGTEADNFAIRGAAEALEPTGRRHLVASAIEHEAVLNTLKALARRGWRTTLVPVDQSGIVSPDRLREAVTDETALVSVMHANNEIGTIQPIAELAAVAHERGARDAHRRGPVGRQDPGGRAGARDRPPRAVGSQIQRAQGGGRALGEARHASAAAADRRQARAKPPGWHRERPRDRGSWSRRPAGPLQDGHGSRPGRRPARPARGGDSPRGARGHRERRAPRIGCRTPPISVSIASRPRAS